MVSNREKKAVLAFIDVYKSMTHLYDKKDENFSNREMRCKAYQTLLKIFKKIDRKVTMDTMKKRISNMRFCCYKEHRKVVAAKRSGSEPYVPTLWYYDAFSFIEHKRPSLQDSAFDDSLLLSGEETNRDDSHVPSKRRKEQTVVIRQSVTNYEANEIGHSKEDDWDVLGRSIGHQLRDLNRRQLTISRKLISDVIYYATLNRLDEDSNIDVRSTTTYGQHAIIHTSQNTFHPFLDESSSSVSLRSPSPQSFTHSLDIKQSPIRSISPYDLILSSPSP